MMLGRKQLLVAAALFGVGSLLPATVWAFDLSGVWASQLDACGQVFTRKGHEVVFAEFSDLFGSGFIVDRDRISGKSGQCTIRSKKQNGDHIEMSTSCASSIMTQDVTFDVTFIDNDTLTRIVPEVPGMTLRYSRCKL